MPRRGRSLRGDIDIPHVGGRESFRLRAMSISVSAPPKMNAATT